MLGKAIALAAELFDGVYDKGGQPYILHCLAVMYGLPDVVDDETRQIAVLHDIFEDTKATPDMLRELGFSERVISGILVLTHRSGESYSDYISRVSVFFETVLVKLSDLQHNSDITRLKGVTEKDLKRIEKYHRAFKYLSAYTPSFKPNTKSCYHAGYEVE